MENKEMKKPSSMELEDDALDAVSGGASRIVAVIISQQDDEAQSDSYAGGIAGCPNSGEIKNC